MAPAGQVWGAVVAEPGQPCRAPGPEEQHSQFVSHGPVPYCGEIAPEIPQQRIPIAVGLPQAIDCLVYLQQGRVDAISTDDSILVGFKAQDPYTTLVGPSLAKVPYGMAISKAHPDFVRFVNGVLERMRTDGTWRRIYSRWLGGLVKSPPPPPTPHYSG